MHLDGSKMSNHSSSKIHSYSWKKAYKAAVLETDDALLEQRIEVAEELLVTRWLELTGCDEHGFGIQAIVDAVKALQVLKRERLSL